MVVGLDGGVALGLRLLAALVLLGGRAALAAPAGTFSLQVERESPLVLGEVEEVGVTIRAPEGEGDRDRPLRLSVNVGSFGPITRVADGVYQSRYHLPETRFPQVALVAVWRETGPDAPVEFLRIPLSGRTRLPVKSSRGAEIRVTVGEQIYGPVRADRSGRASLVIAVPPGVTEVVATSSRGGTLSQGTVPVDVPPYNRLTLAVTPYLVPQDGQSPVTVHAFYDAPGEAPLAERLKLGLEREASAGAPDPEIRLMDAQGGRYRYRFVPARDESADEVLLRAVMGGDKVSRAEVRLSFGVPVPERLVLRAVEPAAVADGRTSSRLRLLVMDRLGLGVGKLVLTASAAGARLERVQELGGGEYTLALVPGAAYPPGGRLALTVRADSTRLTQVLELEVAPAPWPVRASLALEPELPVADGERSFLLYLRAYDAGGAPRPGQEVALSAPGARLQVTGEDAARGLVVTVLPERGLEELRLSLSGAAGSWREERVFPLAPPPSATTVGAWVGVAYNPRLVPSFGVELAHRPGWLGSRLALRTGLAFRQVTQTTQVPGFGPVNARLRLLPWSLGATYALYAGADLSIYAGLGAELVPFEYRVESDFQGAAIYRRLAPGAELALGMEYVGFFAELVVSQAWLDAPGLDAPGPSLTLGLGYRLGVF